MNKVGLAPQQTRVGLSGEAFEAPSAIVAHIICGSSKTEKMREIGQYYRRFILLRELMAG